MSRAEVETFALIDRENFEISVHDSPKALQREIKHVFPSIDLQGLLIIPTLQKSAYDLVTFGGEVDEEKDRLLERFFEFARPFCGELASRGYWADFIDPCSGLPMLTPDCNKVFNEVDCMEVVLGYKTMNCGCCKVLLHPAWGSAVYPASILTTAPPYIVQRFLEGKIVAKSYLDKRFNCKSRTSEKPEKVFKRLTESSIIIDGESLK